MKVLKKLLFLTCIAPTSGILAMDKLIENEQELATYQKYQQTKYDEFRQNNTNEDEESCLESLSLAEFMPRVLNSATIRVNSYYKDQEHINKLNNTKLLDLIQFNSKQNPEEITKFYCFINYSGFELAARKKARNEYFDTIVNLDLKNKQLQKQNEEQAQELKNFHTAAAVRKSTNLAKQKEQPRSWWQRNNRLLSGLSVAAVMGGCMLLGASLYSFFTK